MTRDTPAARGIRSRVLTWLLLASGFCGISYEVLYGRLLGDCIGSQFIVNAAILLTFLVGIGWGTLFGHRLWRYLPVVEAGIGLYALVFSLGINTVDRALYASGIHTAGLVYPLLLSVVLLATPSFLIGVSLPVMAGYMSRLRAGPVFGKSYAAYNIGAAIVVLVIEFFLIRLAGIRLATGLIAALNLAVAAILLVVFADIRKAVPEPRKRGGKPPLSQRLALILVSIGSAIFQLLMIKVAECIFGPFRETFALVLSMVLGGIAIGSWLVHRFRISFDRVILVNLAGLLWLVAGFAMVVEKYAVLHGSSLPLLLVKFFLLLAVMAIPSMSFGATIPALLVRQDQVARESGELLFISSLANGAGFLLMVFVLHQRFDYGVLFLWVALFSLLALCWYCRRPCRQVFAGLAITILFIPILTWQWDENLLYLGHTAFDDRATLNETRARFSFPEKFKGPQDIFSIVWAKGRPRFFINGYISMALDSMYEPLVGALSAVYSPRLDNALVLGVGSGNTASVAGLLFDHTDGVEINGAVLANLHRMKDYNMDIEHNPRVRLVQDDAIHFIKAGSSRYSLIINTVTTPLYFSSAKLYTLDFLQQVKRRLTDDGVYMTWVDSRVGEEGIDIMLRTVGKSFRHCALAYIKSSYFLLLCSKEELHAHNAMAVASHPVLGPRFREQFQIEPEWIAYGLLHQDATRLVHDPNGVVNRLDYPALEFAMSALRNRGYGRFKKRLRRAMAVDALAAAVSPELRFDPAAVVLHAEMVLGDDSSLTRRWRQLIANDPALEERYRRELVDRTTALARSLDTADGYHKAGYRLMENKLYRQAIGLFRQALHRDPGRNNSYFNIGACYEYLKMYDLALQNYRGELEVDPDDSDVPYRIGRVLVKQGRFAAARPYLVQATTKAPGARAFYYLGRANEGLGRQVEARAAYQEALRLDGDDRLIQKAWQAVKAPSRG